MSRVPGRVRLHTRANMVRRRTLQLELDSMREWYAAALKEPWREEQYEAAVRGILIEDQRVPQTA